MAAPSDRELYIHIGYPKTATTFFQQEVFPNLAGVHYPERRLIREELARIVRQDEFSFEDASIKRNIERHLRAGKNLISHEGLVGNPFTHKFVNNKLIADRLSRLFPEAKILITIRNQYGLIESLYKQYVHIGGTRKFRDFVNFRNGQLRSSYCDLGLTINPGMFDFLGLINFYAERFGRDNLCVLPFELLRKDRDEFLRRIYSWIGITRSPELTDRPRNQGFGARQIAVARFLNRFLKSPLNEASAIPDVTLPFVGKIDTGKLRIVLQSSLSRKLLGQKPITDELVRCEIKKIYAAANRELDRKYGLKLEELAPNEYF